MAETRENVNRIRGAWISITDMLHKVKLLPHNFGSRIVTMQLLPSSIGTISSSYQWILHQNAG